MRHHLHYSFFLIGMLLSVMASAKQASWLPIEPISEDTTCFYIQLNPLYEHQVMTIHHRVICLEYEDLYGQSDSIRMIFYDWQLNQLASLQMPKKYGRNAYSLDLEQLGLPFTNQLITLEVTNEKGRKMKSLFKLVAPPNQAPPEVEILVQPWEVSCGQAQGNRIEFYGTIQGGKAPYTLAWEVTKDNQEALLYQPKKMYLPRPGSTPVIEVAHAPSYYVQLVVTDACGKQGKQTVYVQCEERRKKRDSILFQPVPSVTSSGTPSQ